MGVCQVLAYQNQESAFRCAPAGISKKVQLKHLSWILSYTIAHLYPMNAGDALRGKPASPGCVRRNSGLLDTHWNLSIRKVHHAVLKMY